MKIEVKFQPPKVRWNSVFDEHQPTPVNLETSSKDHETSPNLRKVTWGKPSSSSPLSFPFLPTVDWLLYWMFWGKEVSTFYRRLRSPNWKVFVRNRRKFTWGARDVGAHELLTCIDHRRSRPSWSNISSVILGSSDLDSYRKDKVF